MTKKNLDKSIEQAVPWSHSARLAERNGKIYHARLAGGSLKELSENYGISRQRIYQIFRDECLRRGTSVTITRTITLKED